MENENIKKSGILTKIGITFCKIIGVFSVIALCIGLFMGFTNTNFSDIDDFIVLLFEEDFYSEKFDVVNADYLRDSEGFSFDLSDEIEREDFKGLNITEYMKEDLNWEKIYPYFYRYIERPESNVVFRNQGLYVQVKGEYKLISYLTPTIIYFDINNMKLAKQSDVTRGVRLLCETLCSGKVFKDAEYDLKFQNDLSDLGAEFGSVFLQTTFYKPVIYLYPKEETDISVTVEGVNLTTTYPNYNNGWNVTAYPDGTLIDDNGRGYNYLYWEGKSNNFEVELLEGFVVSKNNYIEFLEEKLDYVGLTNKESADFISYWLPYMNEFEYCLVSFQMENYEEQVKLDFSVKPNNELRVFAVFKGLDKPIKIEEQDLSYYNDFERTGFTVVEWGGTIIE